MTQQPALKVHEAAQLANVSTKTIYRALDNCELMAYRIGRAVRIDRDDFDHWFHRQQHKPVAQLVPRAADRPRRLPTTDAKISGARLKALDEEDEAA